MTRTPSGSSGIEVRAARPGDEAVILGFIRDLAEYERSPESVAITESQLTTSLFAPDAQVFAHLAMMDGEPCGMALWFLDFSTWTGRPGIHLEDLYVTPESRGQGIGRRLLATLVSIANERGYARINWSVLTWNEPALSFYRNLGAAPQDEWINYRLDGDALANFPL